MIYRDSEHGNERVYYLGIRPSARYNENWGITYLYENCDFEFIDEENEIFVLLRDGSNLMRNLNHWAALDDGSLNSFPSGHWIWMDSLEERYHIMLHNEEIQESKDNFINSIGTSSFLDPMCAGSGEIIAYSDNNTADPIFKITIQGCKYDIQGC